MIPPPSPCSQFHSCCWDGVAVWLLHSSSNTSLDWPFETADDSLILSDSSPTAHQPAVLRLQALPVEQDEYRIYTQLLLQNRNWMCLCVCALTKARVNVGYERETTEMDRWRGKWASPSMPNTEKTLNRERIIIKGEETAGKLTTTHWENTGGAWRTKEGLNSNCCIQFNLIQFSIICITLNHIHRHYIVHCVGRRLYDSLIL